MLLFGKNLNSSVFVCVFFPPHLRCSCGIWRSSPLWAQCSSWRTTAWLFFFSCHPCWGLRALFNIQSPMQILSIIWLFSFFFQNHDFPGETKLPPGLRGCHQQADQPGAVCLLRLLINGESPKDELRCRTKTAAANVSEQVSNNKRNHYLKREPYLAVCVCIIYIYMSWGFYMCRSWIYRCVWKCFWSGL